MGKEFAAWWLSGPATLLWDDVASHNKFAARAVEMAWARNADQLAVRAAMTAWRKGSGLWRALAPRVDGGTLQFFRSNRKK